MLPSAAVHNACILSIDMRTGLIVSKHGLRDLQKYLMVADNVI